MERVEREESARIKAKETCEELGITDPAIISVAEEMEEGMIEVRDLVRSANIAKEKMVYVQRRFLRALQGMDKISEIATQIGDHPSVRENPELAGLRGSLAINMIRRV